MSGESKSWMSSSKLTSVSLTTNPPRDWLWSSSSGESSEGSNSSISDSSASSSKKSRTRLWNGSERLLLKRRGGEATGAGAAVVVGAGSSSGESSPPGDCDPAKRDCESRPGDEPGAGRGVLLLRIKSGEGVIVDMGEASGLATGLNCCLDGAATCGSAWTAGGGRLSLRTGRDGR